MKIRKIVLHNLGPYFEHNEINIDCEKRENIILIGGKNGAGKTTLFNSLKVCLYGCKAFGFETVNQKYNNEIFKLINDKEKVTNNGYAKVEVELLLDDGIENNVYLLSRIWDVATTASSVKETFVVRCNGAYLDGEKLIDFHNYLMHILPPTLFKFYFFDGEKIADIFLQSNDDNSFKNAFLAISGYDNIDILLKQFQRNVAAKNKNSKISSEYFRLESEINVVNENISQTKKNLKEKQDELLEIQDKINSLDINYLRCGGLTIEKWQEMNKQLITEEQAREGLHRLKKELANNQIPYIILSKKLIKLREQIIAEDEMKRKQIICDFFDRDKVIQEIVKNKSVDKQSVDIALNLVIDYYRKQIGDNNGRIVLDLSTQVKNEILVQIESHLGFNKKQIVNLFKELNTSLQRSQDIRKNIEHHSSENYDEYMKAKDILLREKHSKECVIKCLETEMIKLEIDHKTRENEFKKAKKAYEDELKNLSISDISSRAVLAFGELSERLFKEQIMKIEESFKKIFFSLINKDDFIDGIHIDEKLNISPYRFMRLSQTDVENLLKKKKKESIIEVYGERGYQIIKAGSKSNSKYTNVPVEIKSPFSQGENQVYIMSIYFALMQLSRVQVPFVIDTPFARIDNEHRNNIINNFLIKLRGQVFILSTDEEIDKENESKLNKSINQRYLLQYQSRGKTSIIRDRYFGGSDGI